MEQRPPSPFQQSLPKRASRSSSTKSPSVPRAESPTGEISQPWASAQGPRPAPTTPPCDNNSARAPARPRSIRPAWRCDFPAATPAASGLVPDSPYTSPARHRSASRTPPRPRSGIRSPTGERIATHASAKCVPAAQKQTKALEVLESITTAQKKFLSSKLLPSKPLCQPRYPRLQGLLHNPPLQRPPPKHPPRSIIALHLETTPPQAQHAPPPLWRGSRAPERR